MDYSSYLDTYQQTSSGGGMGSSILSLGMSILAVVAWWFLNVKAGEGNVKVNGHKCGIVVERV